MFRMACAASAALRSVKISKRCGSLVWSMTSTLFPSAASQMVRKSLPSMRMMIARGSQKLVVDLEELGDLRLPAPFDEADMLRMRVVAVVGGLIGELHRE